MRSKRATAKKLQGTCIGFGADGVWEEVSDAIARANQYSEYVEAIDMKCRFGTGSVIYEK